MRLPFSTSIQEAELSSLVLEAWTAHGRCVPRYRYSIDNDIHNTKQWRAFHGRQIWRAYTPHIRVGRTEGVPNPYQKPPTIVGLRKHGFQDFD
jgi:hypothetical protein